MKSSTYYFHVKTKILADFQICISVPLSVENINGEVLLLVKLQGSAWNFTQSYTPP